jgi:maltooligosyltrehalose trehalohydrolase
VANTGTGQRLHQFVDLARWRALSALLLLGPSVPMLFQGQEEAVDAPFTYFADHKEPLASLVGKGRLEFLSQFVSMRDPSFQVPDPCDIRTFRTCRLTWDDTVASRRARQLHADLLALRRTDEVLTKLGTVDVTADSSALTADVVLLRYTAGDAARLVIVNLGALIHLAMNDPLLAPPRRAHWELAWCSEQPAYGGNGVAGSFAEGSWVLQARCAWLLRSTPGERLR